MHRLAPVTSLLALLLASGGSAAPAASAAAPASWSAPALQEVLDYARSQKTTGFLIIQDRKVVARADWPVPAADRAGFAPYVHGTAPDGSLREDVASQQKSFVAILIGIAIDRKLIDLDKPASAYLGKGWSKAPPEAEAKITVRNLTNMNSGLKEDFTYEAPAGTKFFYNTAVYAKTKPLLEKAVGKSIDQITADWLTGPLGMSQTKWEARAASNTDNPTGLVTTPADVAKLGQLVLDGGKAPNGRQVISPAQLAATFQRSPTNPAYGRLWWLNGGDYVASIEGRQRRGQLVPPGPRDMVLALGKLERQLYVVPSRKLIVVRLGQMPPQRGLAIALWERLNKAMPAN